MAARSAVLLLLLQVGCATAAGITAEATNRANPIRKVVNLLQRMQETVTKEGEEKEELFNKYMCYCKNADETLGASIAEAEQKIPQLEAAIKEGKAQLEQLKADTKGAVTSRADAKKAMDEAKALREKEAAAFAKESGDMKTNLAALDKAIPAIEQGMGSSFLQTRGASTIRKLLVTMDGMSSVDREVVASFLSQGSDASYAPQSGEIVGILKQMRDTMAKDLAELEEQESAAIAEFEELMAAKTKEIEALTKENEAKMARIGKLGVQLTEMANDLEDTTEGLEEDKKFLADLEKNCETKKTEWDAYKKMQAEELLALADTIKILNDDDALELFKKTLPSAKSFVQVQVTSKTVQHLALKALQKSHTKDPRVSFLEMALRAGKMDFSKILKMIDDLVEVLKKEQQDDEAKKQYCEAELDKAEDDKKSLERDVSDLQKAIEDGVSAVETLTSEIKELQEGIVELDKSVVEATEQRKKEHEEFVKTLAENTAASDLLAFAKNRLQKFYNPKLYKPAPKRELTEEERLDVNFGGTLATEAPSGIAGTGVGVPTLVQIRAVESDSVAPPPPPEANLAYNKKGQSNNGVLAMIDLLVADLTKENQEMEVEEKDAQQEYEKFMADAQEKRAMDTKSIADKEQAKADTAAEVESNKEALKAKKTELMDTAQYIGSLHTECDWLLKYFDVRKEARAGEIDSLGKAKAVLSGADYSLLQRDTSARKLLRGYRRH